MRPEISSEMLPFARSEKALCNTMEYYHSFSEPFTTTLLVDFVHNCITLVAPFVTVHNPTCIHG